MARLRQLKSVRQIIGVLGGNGAVAELTGAQYNAVCNWRAAKRMPPRYFPLMIKALQKRGCTAAPALWRIDGNQPVVVSTLVRRRVVRREGDLDSAA